MSAPSSGLSPRSALPADPPHVIYILADDMGYGDMRCNAAACRIPTPNLDRLAAAGMRFTDAHAAAAVCTPSRYNLLTGRYAWRSRLKAGIIWHYDGSLIEPDRLTVPQLLRQHGYRTACVGKWHLGFDWPTHDGRHPNESLPFGSWDQDHRLAFEQHINWAARLDGGPVDRGFDSYFGIDVPNFPPYTWFENDRLAQVPTVPKPASLYGLPGLAEPGWDLHAMIPAFTRHAVQQIENTARDPARKPLFLYLALTSPHSPIVPNEPYRGMSGIGPYGDFVCELDAVVGQIMDALQRTGLHDNTLLIFASDNGPEDRVGDDEGVYERARRTRHFSMGEQRGIKFDAWEGGHRVPFLAAWPRVIQPGSLCHQLVCLGDLMATCADILGEPLPPDAGEDSVSMLPLLRGRTDQPTRQSLVYHTCSGRMALREGDWVYINSPTGGDRREPDWYQHERGYTPHDQPGELFHLRDDPLQRINHYAHQPHLVARLHAQLTHIQSTHGLEQAPPASPTSPTTPCA